MYNEELCTIVKAAGGKFIVNMRHKKEKKEEKKEEKGCCAPEGMEYEIVPHVANNVDEISEIIKEYGVDKTDKDKFNEGWKKGKD